MISNVVPLRVIAACRLYTVTSSKKMSASG